MIPLVVLLTGLHNTLLRSVCERGQQWLCLEVSCLNGHIKLKNTSSAALTTGASTGTWILIQVCNWCRTTNFLIMTNMTSNCIVYSFLPTVYARPALQIVCQNKLPLEISTCKPFKRLASRFEATSATATIDHSLAKRGMQKECWPRCRHQGQLLLFPPANNTWIMFKKCRM